MMEQAEPEKIYPSVLVFRRDVMRRGWEVTYRNGKRINEKQMDWNKVPKQDIICLTLHYDGRRWDLDNKDVYFQKKRASMIPGIPESFQVESRSIGYSEDNCKVWYTVNEHTGMMQISVEEFK